MKVRAPSTADLHEVLALVQSADRAVYGDTDWTEPDLRRDWEEMDIARDAWIVEVGGRVGGYGFLENRGGGAFVGDGYVHPDLHGSGIGSRLLDLLEGRAREQRGDGRSTLKTGVLTADERARRLFEGRGYRLLEQQYRMVIDLEEPPPEPRWPDGIRTEPLDPADARELFDALREAWGDDWTQTFDDFRDHRLGSEHFDPSLCRVARSDGEIVGGTLSDWKRNGNWGWIGSVGVRPGWRRRGLGFALLLESFGEFYRRGERRIALGVTAENPTGATRLYERAGMHVLYRIDVYQKELDA